MRKMPSQEEPREESETYHPESYSLPQRRRRAADSRLPPRIFYSDEHPEIPKIKRASRYSSAPDGLSVAPAKRKRCDYSTVDKPPTEDQTASSNEQEDVRKQPLPRLTFSQQLTSRPKLIAVGGVVLAMILLMLAMISTSHQLSAQDIQMPVNSQGNNTISFHNTDAGNSRQIAIPQQSGDHPVPPVLATSAYLLDADTGATLYASNPSMHLPMLSTTKLMTALVATQIGNLNHSILINDTITNEINQIAAYSSLMGIKRGETYTLKDLLYGMLMVSGNDAAIAIADQLGGGNQQNFVDKMNQEAAKLGLHDTHYTNPHGLLAEGHFSSAHDLVLLEKYSLSVPLIHTISTTREYDIPKNDKHDIHNMFNENQFLWWYPGVDGGKQGWDAATNYVQVISCIRNHRHLIGAVMHTVDWWTDMRDLMNWGFNTYTWISPGNANSPSNPIPFAADWHYFQKDKKEKTIPTADKGRYYIYTGYSISDPIMTYFDKNGGLNTFGYPTSQTKSLSNNVLVQQFNHRAIYCNQQTQQCNKT